MKTSNKHSERLHGVRTNRNALPTLVSAQTPPREDRLLETEAKAQKTTKGKSKRRCFSISGTAGSGKNNFPTSGINRANLGSAIRELWREAAIVAPYSPHAKTVFRPSHALEEEAAEDRPTQRPIDLVRLTGLPPVSTIGRALQSVHFNVLLPFRLFLTFWKQIVIGLP